MNKYRITLFYKADPSIGFRGCYNYETISAPSNKEARKYAKDNLLSFRGYSAKLVSVRKINS